MDNKITINENFEDSKKIRQTVFVEEQGFDPEIEFDDIDEYATHMALYLDGKPIGSGRLYETEENVFRLGRIAILKEYREMGYGKILLSEMEKKAIEKGARHLILLGQITAKGFYNKLGYKEIGDVSTEDYVPEIYMRKTVRV